MSGAVIEADLAAPPSIVTSADRAKPASDETQAVSLSLVIPAWNEQETIEQAIREADSALSRIAAEYEIIVVDDGSSDKTAALVRTESDLNPRVRLIAHSENRGYGAALRTGFEAARCELVAFTDADCQFDLNELARLVPLTREADIVCGYRLDRQDPPLRRFFSWGYNSLVTALLGTQVRDVDCALKIFRREQLDAIMPESRNYFANAEMLTAARSHGLTVVEAGVRHRPRAGGQSKVSLREIPKTLARLMPFWWSRVLFPAETSRPARPAWFWPGAVLLLLVCVCLLFLHLAYPLLEPDEGRYAEIAREMLSGGDWVVPRLYLEAYLDKPPLLYWLVSASFEFFGTSPWAARLVPAAAAFLTVLSVLVFGTRMMGGRVGLMAALVLALSIGFVDFGRVLILDGLLSLLVTVALFCGYEAIRTERFHWSWWVMSAASCGLGVLTKGPVALVLVAPPLAAHAWLTGSRIRPNRWHWLGYIALVASVAGPWYAAIVARQPAFAMHFFWKHNVLRFFGSEYHPKTIFFYVPVLLLACMPWTLLMVPFVKFLFNRSASAQSLRPKPLGFFLLWAGWCVLFFSASHGKLPPYILPALPAVALTLGYYLDQVVFHPAADTLIKGYHAAPRHALAVLCGGAIGVNISTWLLRLPHRHEFLWESAAWAAAIAAIALYGRRLSPKAAWSICCVVALAVNFESSHRLIPAWAIRNSPLTQSKQLPALLKEDGVALACYGREWGAVAFHFGRDDILNFSLRPRRDLTEFLAAHPKTIVMIKRSADVGWFHSALPAGMKMTQIATGSDATVAIVESARPAEVVAASDQGSQVR